MAGRARMKRAAKISNDVVTGYIQMFNGDKKGNNDNSMCVITPTDAIHRTHILAN